MPPDELITPADLTRWVHAAYGLALDAVGPVTDGADHRASTWRGVAGAWAYAIRVSRQTDSAGAPVLEHLARQRVRGVPVPVRTLGGALSAVADDLQLSVIPWLDGVADHGAQLTRPQWSELGQMLRQVHDVDPTPLAGLISTERFDHQWHDETLAQVRHGLDRPSTESLGTELARLWQQAQPRIERVQTRMHELARVPPATEPRRVLCHSDPHLGNVVVGPDSALWLIDWHDAVLAPRERDLIFVLGGVIADRLVGPREQTWFFAGYGPVSIDADLITWFRCLRAIEDLALPAVEILQAARPADQLRGELAIIRGVLSPTGLISQVLGQPS